MVQIVKKPPTVQEMQVRSLDWEDPLEEGTYIPMSKVKTNREK